MAINAVNLAGQLVQFLQGEIVSLPNGFFDTFNYTTTRNNLTHPLVLGLLTRFAWDVDGVSFVGLDVALNEGEGVKFKPDVIGYSNMLQPLFIIDYESPNSSDYRIITKDVDGYITWRDYTGRSIPFVIITTLPQVSSWWECRWVSKNCYNEQFKDKTIEWAANPWHFWHAIYNAEFANRAMQNIIWININGNIVSQVFPELALPIATKY